MWSHVAARAREKLVKVLRSGKKLHARGERPVAQLNSNVYIVLAVSVAAIVGAVIAWLQLRHDIAGTSTADIVITAESRADTVPADYVIGASADFRTLPANPGAASCTDGQVAWLKEHGTLVRPYRIELINEGSGEGFVRASDPRFEHTSQDGDTPLGVVFSCPDAGLADTVVAHLKPGNGPGDDVIGSSGDDGGPVAFNLAAGEAGYVDLFVRPGMNTVVGMIFFTVAADDGEHRVVVNDERVDSSITIPGTGTEEPLNLSISTTLGAVRCNHPRLEQARWPGQGHWADAGWGGQCWARDLEEIARWAAGDGDMEALMESLDEASWHQGEGIGAFPQPSDRTAKDCAELGSRERFLPGLRWPR
jgi:hypothetical protein